MPECECIQCGSGFYSSDADAERCTDCLPDGPSHGSAYLAEQARVHRVQERVNRLRDSPRGPEAGR